MARLVRTNWLILAVRGWFHTFGIPAARLALLGLPGLVVLLEQVHVGLGPSLSRLPDMGDKIFSLSEAGSELCAESCQAL